MLADHIAKLIEEMLDESGRRELLLPTERLFSDLESARLPAFFEKLCRSGCEIYQKKIGKELPTGARVRVLDASGKFFALGEVREFENGQAIKPIKQLR